MYYLLMPRTNLPHVECCCQNDPPTNGKTRSQQKEINIIKSKCSLKLHYHPGEQLSNEIALPANKTVLQIESFLVNIFHIR